MAIEIKAPTFPESVADGTVATWHKQPGDAVKRDELIVDIETDKVVLEVLATADGVLGAIVKNEGDTVLSDEVLGSIVEGGAAAAAGPRGQQPGPGGRAVGGAGRHLLGQLHPVWQAHRPFAGGAFGLAGPGHGGAGGAEYPSAVLSQQGLVCNLDDHRTRQGGAGGLCCRYLYLLCQSGQADPAH